MYRQCYTVEKVTDFIKLIDEMDYVAGQCRYYSLERYIKQAERLAKDDDDFAKYMYVFNLKTQITTWGEFSRSKTLHDYSNRIWSGLISGFYKPRWERWLQARINELEGKPFEDNINWFEWEWHWVCNIFKRRKNI